jgi:hypothetical protein
MNRIFNFGLSAVAAVAFFGKTDCRLAVPMLSIDVDDNGSVDFTFSNASGFVSTGATPLNLAPGRDLSATATTYPLLGTPSTPQLATVALSIGGPGTVAIYFSQDGYGPSSAGFLAELAITALGTGGTVTYATYASALDANPVGIFTGTDPGGPGSGIDPITLQTLGALGSTSALGTIPFSTNNPPFSLMQKVIVSQQSGATGLSVNLATVPEGGSALALLGLALAGVEGVRRKMRKS